MAQVLGFSMRMKACHFYLDSGVENSDWNTIYWNIIYQIYATDFLSIVLVFTENG